MHFNRFDIVMAHTAYYMAYHEGQSDWRYERLSRILTYFRPSPLWSGRPENENQEQIYDALIDKHELS